MIGCSKALSKLSLALSTLSFFKIIHVGSFSVHTEYVFQHGYEFRLCNFLSNKFDALFFFFEASEEHLQYPAWALAVLSLLIIFAMIPVPVGLIHAVLQDRTKQTSRDTEAGQYRIVSTEDKCETPMTDMSELDQRNGTSALFT